MAYVNLVFDDGWLMAAVGASSQRIALCKFTEVEVIESRGGRTYFTAMDGPHAGRLLSLKDANAAKHLGSVAPFRKSIQAVVAYGRFDPSWTSRPRGEVLQQQLATLTVEGLSINVAMNSDWGGQYSPLPTGEYKILTPDAPHDYRMTRPYRATEPTLKFDQVWFPIRYEDNSRFIHVGHLSHGCVSVLDLDQWDNLHDLLISHRPAEQGILGNLTVKGVPRRTP